MRTIWVGIDPRPSETRILVMDGAETTLLKARFLPSPSSRLALPTLLEAIALWQGRPVHAVLVAGTSGRSCGTSLYLDSFPDFGSARRCPALC